MAPGPSYRSGEAVLLESFDDLAPYTEHPGDRDVDVVAPGQGGPVLSGVAQRLERNEGGKEGGHYALYTAESDRADPDGWSVVGRTFDPPRDLSACAGIGLWLRGDGQGGLFKLQLRDGTGALDHYIANDYQGWRYHQLARPPEDPIDFGEVGSMLFYFNGLPGSTAVSCGIDDVKALPHLDRQAAVNPTLELEGGRLGWVGVLTAGQYLSVWPDEPIRLDGPDLDGRDSGNLLAPRIELPPGTHRVRWSSDGARTAALRVRLTFQTAERHPIP